MPGLLHLALSPFVSRPTLPQRPLRRSETLRQLSNPRLIIKPRHPPVPQRLLILLIKLPIPTRHRALSRHAERDMTQRLRRFNTMPIQTRQQAHQGIQTSMPFEVELMDITVLEPPHVGHRPPSLLQPHVQSIVTIIHPRESTLHELLGNQKTQPMPPDRTLNRAAPSRLLRPDFDQLGRKRQLIFSQRQMLRQVSTKLLIRKRNIGSRPCFDFPQLPVQSLLLRLPRLLGPRQPPTPLLLSASKPFGLRLPLLPGMVLIGEQTLQGQRAIEPEACRYSRRYSSAYRPRSRTNPILRLR